MRKLRVPISVLVVDDDRDARTMYRMYLRHAGCKVRTARDGIVMDLAMPRLDGWTTSRWLKSSPATAHIPIIALSAAPMSRKGARAIGCDGFLAKPCPPALLWWEIRAVLHPPT